MFEGLFDFLQDADNYEERRVARYEEDDLFISTCRVSDSTKPFETAVAHPKYNGGKIVIVELYNTEKEAQEGHARWVNTMSSHAPRVLHDVSTCTSAVIASMFGYKPPIEKGV